LAALWPPPMPTMAARGNIVIIANNKLPLAELSKKEIRNIFLGKYVHWKSGERVEFAILEKSGDTADIHAVFTRDYLNKSPKQYLYYWKKMMFTGKGTPPKSFEKESGLLDYVGSTKGAIGYISKSALKENEIQKIKKIRVTE
jgi:ABC-type phosphate transport system substrate-binding protein